MRPLAVISNPAAWVFAQAGLIGAFLFAAGEFEPRVNPDTATYRQVSFDSLRSVLSQTRTFGYPAFLRAVEAMTGSESASPFFHYAAFSAATIGFCFSLRSFGFSAGSAGAASSALLYSRVAFEMTRDLAADELAAAGAVVSASLLLLVTKAPRSVTAWAGLTIAVFLTYQIRPAYLILVPVVPLVGFLLSVFVLARPIISSVGLGFAAALAAATFIPLAAFCLLRWSTVGHFGLVSYGGYNLIGLTGQFLDPGLAEEVAPEVRPLARRIIERRELVDGWKPPDDFAAMATMYNPTVWTLTAPAAEELYGGDAVLANRSITLLAREVIRLRPKSYGRWLVWSAREAARDLLFLFITDRGTRLCLLVLLSSQGWVVWRRWRSGPLPSSAPKSEQQFLEVNTLLCLALTFAAAKVLLVILVEIPIGRYLSAAALFLPSIAAVLTWYRCVAVFATKREP